MNTLIIGGSKFVGLRLAHKLAEQGHDVTALNRGVSGGRLPAGVRALKADRRDAAGLLAALAAGARGGFDAVFDICGYLPADVESFAAALGAAGLRIKHYVFCSSVAVYDFEAIKFCPVREEPGPVRGLRPQQDPVRTRPARQRDLPGYDNPAGVHLRPAQLHLPRGVLL